MEIGGGEAGARRREEPLGLPEASRLGFLSKGFSRLGLQIAVAMQKGRQTGEDSERSGR